MIAIATRNHTPLTQPFWVGSITTILRGLLLAFTMLAGIAYATQAGAQGTTATAAEPAPLSEGQLEQLVAPIALYPDDLLAQVLMASTYPLEVVQAARWASQNPGATGKALEDAMAQQPWDSSVKGLAAVPQILQMMSEKLDWTQQLGDAFLAQQSALLDAVQRLRQRADAAGNLKTTPQQKVARMSQPGPSGQPVERIVVERADPDTLYVPYYDPGVAFGTWPYPDYPPYYWPGYGAGAVFAGAVGFTAAAVVGSAIWGRTNWWGGGVGINPLRYNSFNRTNITSGNWNHVAAHRGNVPYRDRGTAQRFGGSTRTGAGARNRTGTGQIGQKGAGGGQKRAGAGGGQKKAGAGGGGQRKAGAGGGQKKAAAKNKGGAGKSAGKARGGGGHAARGGGPRGGGAARAGGGPRGGGGMHARGGGGMHARGGGGMRGGGGGRGGGGRGGGRRSDINVKHDIVLLGHLDNGLGFYRFSYNGSHKAYVGVMAQEVQSVRPDAVTRDRDGTLRVRYDLLGVRFQTYDQWVGSGARVPAAVRAH